MHHIVTPYRSVKFFTQSMTERCLFIHAKLICIQLYGSVNGTDNNSVGAEVSWEGPIKIQVFANSAEMNT